jgi:uncharacterized protein
MIVVSDSTPLITLMKARQLPILHHLFGEVLIPEAVFEELTTNETYKDEADLIRSESYIRVVSVANTEYVAILQRATGLDLGESEAIVYADENKADVLLIDEVAGRRVAQNMSLPIAGSIGILLLAFDRGLLNACEAEKALKRIENSGRHISRHLLQNARNAIHGETNS